MLLSANINKNFIRLSLSFVTLFIGGMIYILYRDESLIMFSWAKSLGISDFIQYLRNTSCEGNIYYWIKFNLPAALWVFSYLFIIDSIWNKKTALYYVYLSAIPIMGICSEILQLFNLIPGTFDIMDLVGYFCAIGLFIILKKFT